MRNKERALAVLPTGYGKSLFQLLPGICPAPDMMGYTSYPKKAIFLVICLLNALIESHMKELRFSFACAYDHRRKPPV